MKLKKYAAGATAQVEFDASPFGDKLLYRTLKDAVLMYRANARLGTVNTRGRDQVKGSNKKPWKQKHTGRARAGDRKSPIWPAIRTPLKTRAASVAPIDPGWRTFIEPCVSGPRLKRWRLTRP